MLQWTEDSVETLRGCFECTDWNMFHNLELNEATETITDYINFCVNNVVPKKVILHYPNNKPHITKEVKTCINNKKLAFRNNDRAGAAAAQKELNQLMRRAREKHRVSLEEGIRSMNNKKLWDCMKKMTNMNSNRKLIVTTNDQDCANELNDYFLRFDMDSSLKVSEGFNIDSILTCNPSDQLEITHQQVQSIFNKVCTKKSIGPDGLPVYLLKKCSSELATAWCPIFKQSLDSHTVTALWKSP